MNTSEKINSLLSDINESSFDVPFGAKGSVSYYEFKAYNSEAGTPFNAGAVDATHKRPKKPRKLVGDDYVTNLNSTEKAEYEAGYEWCKNRMKSESKARSVAYDDEG